MSIAITMRAIPVHMAKNKIMRFKKIQEALTGMEIDFDYQEEDDCGAIDFWHRGLFYHIWEYPEPERGAQSNVKTAGKMEDYEDDYEELILKILRQWK